MKKIFTLLWLTLAAFTFKATAQSCNAEFGVQYLTNFTVKFNPVTNNDSPYVHHYWSFGDGTTGSQLISPTHTYALAGNYAVVHTVVRVTPNNTPVCTQTFTKVVSITEPCNLVVNFSWTSVASNPLTLAFQNLSVPLAATDSISWQFGDGTSSNAVNPVHTYANAGTYNVCLIVKKNNSNTTTPCIRYLCKTVVIQAPCNLVVDFNWTVTQTNPLRIEFHNLSTPLAATDSIRWTFGDGTSSNDVNPVHTYTAPGTYTVCLRVQKATPAGSAPCVREICKTIVVQAPCNMVPDFTWTTTAANPLTIAFQNTSTNTAATDSIRWTFGDGTTSNQLNPVHTYAAPGTYTVCLRITRYNVGTTAPCVREICKTVVVQAPCNMVVDFNWTVTQTNPLRIEFHNLTTPVATNDSIRWTFGDGTSSNVSNPIHTYTAPGTYTVCLRIIRYNGSNTPCIREICKTIVVTAPCNMVPDFTWNATQTNPLKIEFHNTSTNTVATDSMRWSFGDGTFSSDLNPIHTYAAPGTYTVCLKIIRYYSNTTTPCVREICKTVVVYAPCNMVPDFTWTVTQTNPLRIEFHNTSTNTVATDSVRWSFGDGTFSNDLNPVHTYTAPGTYTVCLRITRYNAGTTAPCVREICKTIVVQAPCTLVVNFTSQPDSANPLRIKFSNTSTPIAATDSLFWTFGDGTTLNGLQSNPNVANPIHNYANAGNYNVCLIVKKYPYTVGATTSCVRYSCRTITVFEPCTLVVNFTSQPDPAHPLRIKFTNTSTPMNATDSVRWTFGDGTSVSGLQSDPNVANPTHNYANAGTYTVCLRVKKNNSANTPTTPACVREKCNTVVVTAPCNFTVNFSWRLDSINVKKVYFTNLTIPPTANSFAVWNFGDGATATTWNAVHEYALPGQYRVCLRVYSGQNTTCFRETCDTVVIPVPVPPCTQLANYHHQVSPNDNQKYKFTPDYINTTFHYTWTFGDGTGSNDPIAEHRYAQPGTYVACLTVWRSNTCAATSCHTIVVAPQINCDTAHAGYTYIRSTTMANQVQFIANATLPIIDQVWTISRIGSTTAPVTLHQNNPLYTFPDTGYYRVCLRATLQGGCVKEYCNYIYIQQLSNICELQAFPNPASAVVNVNLTLAQPEMIHVYVYNNLNVVVLQQNQQGVTGNNLVTLNIANLIAGQYTIKLIYGNSVCIARFQKL